MLFHGILRISSCIDDTTEGANAFEPGCYSFSAGGLKVRPGTIPLTITYSTGMKIRFSVVAAIMPPKTVVPTEMRPARGAGRAGRISAGPTVFGGVIAAP